MAKKCIFKKKNGERCDADAQSGKSVCIFHDPTMTTEGRRARRAGGLARSRAATVLPADTPDHPLSNTLDVATFLAGSINQLRRGELDSRVANGLGYLTSVLLSALEKGPLEERMAKIEAELKASAKK
jgi:hypothetical protein